MLISGYIISTFICILKSHFLKYRDSFKLQLQNNKRRPPQKANNRWQGKRKELQEKWLSLPFFVLICSAVHFYRCKFQFLNSFHWHQVVFNNFSNFVVATGLVFVWIKNDFSNKRHRQQQMLEYMMFYLNQHTPNGMEIEHLTVSTAAFRVAAKTTQSCKSAESAQTQTAVSGRGELVWIIYIF